MFDLLSFLATPAGMAAASLVAAGLVLVWEWHIALLGLVAVQLAVATVVVQRHDMPAQWALVQVAVVGLGCIILALSQSRMPASRSLRQSGTWILRLLVVGLAYYGLSLISAGWALPELDSETTQMLARLALTAALILAFGESPLYVGVGLLLWCVVVQAVIGPMLGIPALVAMIGIIELLVALACSYLVLVEEAPQTMASQVITDVSFPIVVAKPNGVNGQQAPLGSPPAGGDGLVQRATPAQPAERPATLPMETPMSADMAIGQRSDEETL
jgi:hypothetical protein